MARVFLGLGSNDGDRLANLRAARDALPPSAASSVYETEPQGDVLDQPDFLNACLLIEWEESPEELLELVKGVESTLGRSQGGARHAPRPIDVDVLLIGDLSHRSERLIVPHPELTSRRFVLEPLVELDPELRLPDGTRAKDALAAVADQRVTRVGPL